MSTTIENGQSRPSRVGVTFWRGVYWLVDRTRYRVVYKLGKWIDKADRRLMVLGWKARDKFDPPPDGVPF